MTKTRRHLLLATAALLFSAPLFADLSSRIRELEEAAEAEFSTKQRELIMSLKDEDAANARTSLVKGLDSTKPAVRQLCARLLGSLATADEASALIARLDPTKEKEEAVRVACINALRAYEGRASARTALLARFNAEEVSFAEKVAIAATLADIANPDDEALMGGYLAPASDAGLGAIAVRYYTNLANGAGHAKLVEFLDAKSTTDDTSTWAYSRADWGFARQMAVIALADAGHPRAAEFVVGEIVELKNFREAAGLRILDLSKTMGAALAEPLKAELLNESRRHQSWNQAVLALGRLGSAGLEVLVERMDAAIKTRDEKRAGGDASAQNIFANFFKSGIEELGKHSEGRTAIASLFLTRILMEEDEVAPLLFEELLRNPSEESAAAIDRAIESSNEDLVIKAIRGWYRAKTSTEPQALGDKILKHKDEAIRTAPAVLQELATAMNQGNTPVRRSMPVLEELFKVGNEDVRVSVFGSVTRSVDFETFEFFKRGLNDESDKVRYQAAQAIYVFISSTGLIALDEKDKTRNSRLDEITSTVLETLKDGRGGAVGILSTWSSLSNILFSGKRADSPQKQVFLEEAREYLSAEDLNLRLAAWGQFLVLKSPELLRQGFEELKTTSNPLIAYKLSGSLNGTLDPTDKDQLELARGVLPALIKWLGVRSVKVDPAELWVFDRGLVKENMTIEVQNNVLNFLNYCGQTIGNDRGSDGKSLGRNALGNDVVLQVRNALDESTAKIPSISNATREAGESDEAYKQRNEPHLLLNRMSALVQVLRSIDAKGHGKRTLDALQAATEFRDALNKSDDAAVRQQAALITNEYNNLLNNVNAYLRTHGETADITLLEEAKAAGWYNHHEFEGIKKAISDRAGTQD